MVSRSRTWSANDWQNRGLAMAAVRRRNRTASPLPESLAGPGTCWQRRARQPVHRNHPARPRPPNRIEEPTDRRPLRRRTSPRPRRGIQPPRTPQEGYEAATNGLSCKSGATAQPSLAGSPHDVLQKGPCRVDSPGASAPSSGRGTGLRINPLLLAFPRLFLLKLPGSRGAGTTCGLASRPSP